MNMEAILSSSLLGKGLVMEEEGQRWGTTPNKNTRDCVGHFILNGPVVRRKISVESRG